MAWYYSLSASHGVYARVPLFHLHNQILYYTEVDNKRILETEINSSDYHNYL